MCMVHILHVHSGLEFQKEIVVSPTIFSRFITNMVTLKNFTQFLDFAPVCNRMSTYLGTLQFTTQCQDFS